MTTRRTHFPLLRRLLWLASAAGCCAAVGCRSEANERYAQLDRPDPLLGHKIPPQDIPVPGRGGDRYGAKGGDPLLRADARGGAKTPFRPNEDTMPGALASGEGVSRDGGTSDLHIPDDRRTGSVSTARGSLSGDQMAEELQKLGARLYPPEKKGNGDYEFRCAVPYASSGALSTYVGTGFSRDAAIRDAYEQVRADRRK